MRIVVDHNYLHKKKFQKYKCKIGFHKWKFIWWKFGWYCEFCKKRK